MTVNAASLALGRAKSSIREIAAYAAARKAAIGAEKVYDFSLGNPSVPAPLKVKEAILHALELPPTTLHGYTPATGLPQVREAIAASLCRRFGEQAATRDALYLSCGAAASLTITFNALCTPGDEIIVIAPYFPEYRVFIEAAGARCREVAADPETFQVDADAVAAALTPRTRAVVINSPNNPTGVVYTLETLTALADVLSDAEKRFGSTITLVSDEPYRELAYGVEVPWVPHLYARTIVCYSYSKSLSLPGERIGWVLVAPNSPEFEELTAAIAGAGRKLGFVCAPALFQHVVAECVDVPADIEAYLRNREALTKGMDSFGYDYVKPDGAFYLWVRAPGGDAEAFFERARELELLPVPSTSFGCGGWVRIGYCVSYDTILASMPAWEQLAQGYKQSR